MLLRAISRQKEFGIRGSRSNNFDTARLIIIERPSSLHPGQLRRTGVSITLQPVFGSLNATVSEPAWDSSDPRLIIGQHGSASAWRCHWRNVLPSSALADVPRPRPDISGRAAEIARRRRNRRILSFFVAGEIALSLFF